MDRYYAQQIRRCLTPVIVFFVLISLPLAINIVPTIMDVDVWNSYSLLFVSSLVLIDIASIASALFVVVKFPR